MRFPFIILFVIMSASAMAQNQGQNQKQVQLSMSKEEMMARRKEIQDAINETEAQLERLKMDKKATIGELQALQDKLAQRQRLIENINDEMEDIDNTIRSSSKEVNALRQNLDQLKIRYAQSIRYAYETRSSYDMLAFLFSSRDFNDAMLRMKYLKKFRDFRKQQVDQIHATQNQLQHKITVLSTEKKQKDELLNTQVEQKKVLIKETDETNQVIQQLKGKESELMKSIEANRIKEKRVSQYIAMVIEREIEKAAKEAEEKRKKDEADEKRKAAELAKANAASNTEKTKTENTTENVPVTPRSKAPKADVALLSTPTDIALSSNFEGNKGKLYWPVDRGYITDHFGVHPHPIETQVMINNDGVDIQTSPNATIKAVFEGTVSNIATIEGAKMVMIQHGNYYTVYNNLSSVSVSKNDHVNTNQPIGVVANNDLGDPTVKFQIWKITGHKAAKLNPEQWLGKAK